MEPKPHVHTRTGPKLRTRYCTFCGAKCEGARVAKAHCKGKGKGKADKSATPKLSQ